MNIISFYLNKALLFYFQGGSYGSFSLLYEALIFDLQGGTYGVLLAYGRSRSLLQLLVTNLNV